MQFAARQGLAVSSRIQPTLSDLAEQFLYRIGREPTDGALRVAGRFVSSAQRYIAEQGLLLARGADIDVIIGTAASHGWRGPEI
jgi:hypothetical protein